jgi:hypothetical protein
MRSSQYSYWGSGCSKTMKPLWTPVSTNGGEDRLERSRGVGGVLGFPAAAWASYRPAWAAAFILGVEDSSGGSGDCASSTELLPTPGGRRWPNRYQLTGYFGGLWLAWWASVWWTVPAGLRPVSYVISLFFDSFLFLFHISVLRF